MSYATLMVHLELGRPNATLMKITADLAERLHAGVIGIAACRPLQMVYNDGFVSGDLYQQHRDEMTKELGAAEAEFRAALHGCAAFVEWRATRIDVDLADYLANEARSADLVLTGVASGDFLDASRAVNTGELIMQVGRPVLIVPSNADNLRLDHALIGWKDTRETRRAVSDALPLLRLATRVSVVEIAKEASLRLAETHVKDVVSWLSRHRIAAEGTVRGAGLDVLDNEKLDTLTPAQQATFGFLRAAPNVVLSPHIGGWTHQSYQRINEVLTAKIAAFLGQTPADI